MSYRLILFVAGGFALALASSCTSDGVGGSQQPLVASCVESSDELDPEDWLCPDDLMVECEDGEGNPETIYLEPAGDLSDSTCDDIELTLNDEGPFGVGEHDVVVTAEASVEDGEPATFECEAKLTVVDTEPPTVETKTVELWPPNHKYKTISADDCADITDACDEDVEVTFLTASSDEPVNDKGDGNTDPDIVFGCDGVMLRAERQGGGNGRVYRLTWVASDDAGHETDGECIVTVPHDQSGDEAIDDGPAYTMMASDDLDCDDGDNGEGCECESCECESCECDDAEMCSCEACECTVCECEPEVEPHDDDD